MKHYFWSQQKNRSVFPLCLDILHQGGKHWRSLQSHFPTSSHFTPSQRNLCSYQFNYHSLTTEFSALILSPFISKTALDSLIVIQEYIKDGAGWNKDVAATHLYLTILPRSLAPGVSESIRGSLYLTFEARKFRIYQLITIFSFTTAHNAIMMLASSQKPRHSSLHFQLDFLD